MSIIGTIHEDVTTDILGVIGSWQWLVTFVATALSVPYMLNQYEDMFLLAPPKSVECDLTDLSITNSSICTFRVTNRTEETRCTKWHLKFLWVIWIKKSWLFFCDEKLKVLSTTIICRLGVIFGSIIFGLISDSFGRKRAMTINLFADVGFRLTLTFCDSESWFLLLIFLRSMFSSANAYMTIILICEISSNCWRTRLETIVSMPRLLAIVCLVPLANSGPNMETFNFISCVYSAFLLILLRWTPESPQWLLYNQKISEAETLLRKAAKMNGISLCNDFKIRPVDHRVRLPMTVWTKVGRA
nr:solute carrier family 22 member 4-like [Danaus plexippus plexippus]